MSVKGRREEYAKTTRAAIVEAAIARFTVDGYAKSTLDAIAEAARVTKGAIYNHFNDKADLFEAAFVAMEERLLAKVIAGTAGIGDPWQLLGTGVDLFLAEACEPDFRRIALQDAPTALGWTRWKEIEERYFLGLTAASLQGLAQAGQLRIPPGDLTARVVLAATAEAGLAVAAAADPKAARHDAGALILRLVEGLRS